MTETRKIRIRLAGKNRIRVSEKPVYTCRACFNKYYSLFYFCPQCLGTLTFNGPKRSSTLNIVSLQKANKEDLIGLLRFLSTQKNFEFEKSLRSLPWGIIRQTDLAVIQHWKETIDAQRAETEIVATPPSELVRKKRSRPALFASDAPLPSFFPGNLEPGVRNVGQLLRNTAIRLQWAQTVGLAFRIIEASFKHYPDQRILFSDLFYKMEQELHNSVHEFHSYYKTKEEDFGRLIEQLRATFEQIEAEMQAVRRHVQEQL